MHILITGGAGFIGSNLVEFHLAKGDKVHVIDDLSTGSLENIAPFRNSPNFQFDKSNVTNCRYLNRAVEWADRIYHLAATIGMFRVLSEPVNVLTNNIMCCEAVFSAAARKKNPPRIIFASSSSVYGQSQDEAAKEDSNLVLPVIHNLLYNYAVSKVTGEALAMAYFNTFNVPIIIVRIFNTIGPRQTGKYGMVVPRLVGQACRGEVMTVFGDGTQCRSFCDVRDTITAFDLLANTDASLGQIVNVGNDYVTSINDLALIVKKLAHSQSVIHHIPYLEAYGKAVIDIKKRKPDISKLTQLTNFKHQWTLERTISDLIERANASI
jgi:UDP-glucose 4-epimerase